jgi:hypothetical protein
MRLRRDTIRVEESAVCADRLSLHRLPTKRRRALHHLGFRAAPGFGRDQGLNRVKFRTRIGFVRLPRVAARICFSRTLTIPMRLT